MLYVYPIVLWVVVAKNGSNGNDECSHTQLNWRLQESAPRLEKSPLSVSPPLPPFSNGKLLSGGEKRREIAYEVSNAASPYSVGRASGRAGAWRLIFKEQPPNVPGTTTNTGGGGTCFFSPLLAVTLGLPARVSAGEEAGLLGGQEAKGKSLGILHRCFFGELAQPEQSGPRDFSASPSRKAALQDLGK